MKNWPLEYQKVIKTYLCTYLRDSNDSRDSSDSSDSSNSSNSSDSSDSNDSSDKTTLYTKTSRELQNSALEHPIGFQICQIALSKSTEK